MDTSLRLYFGKLDPSVTEDDLLRLFQEQGFNLTNIQLKRGYAFVDCPDQLTFDRAIDSFNGFNFMGSVMQVEPSMSKPRGRRNTKIVIHNFPGGQVDKKQLDNIVGTFGTVQRCDYSTEGGEPKVYVTYETPEQAETAIDQLNGYDINGTQLKVEFARNGKDRYRTNNNGERPSNSRTGSGYPLRILVPTDDVGAIIGRGGQTIRGITTDCKVRVDVHRKDTTGMLEKVISIYGTPENCTNACKAILDIRVKEARENNRGGEIILKLLADDRFCGRIIGKGGANIRKIKEETNGRVVVSKNYSFAYRTGETNLPTILPDRVVNIRGTVEEMSAAEAQVSAILRECYDKEMQAPMQPGDMMMHGMQQMAMLGPHGGAGGGVYGLPQPGPFGMMGPGRGYYHQPPYLGAGQSPMQQQQGQPVVTSHLYVPNSFVGAIIGTNGSNIKKIMRESGAFVSIDSKKDNENPAAERTVTIKGSPEAQWRACFYIFNKLKMEGHSGFDDVRLRSAIKVSSSMVGRVIGKRGKNVREIQRTTGAMVKVPTTTEQGQQAVPATQGEDTDVDVFGTFYQIQHAQAKIRSLVGELQQGPGGMAGQGGGPGMYGPGQQQRRPRGPMAAQQ